jgi:hypothetical protein
VVRQEVGSQQSPEQSGAQQAVEGLGLHPRGEGCGGPGCDISRAAF